MSCDTNLDLLYPQKSTKISFFCEKKHSGAFELDNEFNFLYFAAPFYTFLFPSNF